MMQPRPAAATNQTEKRKGKKKKSGRQRISPDMINEGFASQSSQNFGGSQLSQNGNWSQMSENSQVVGSWTQDFSKLLFLV